MTTSVRRTDHTVGANDTGRRLAYDPALDGLRAVAVLAVMLYHAGVGAVRGGYLGVDLFFVLSGFLITTLLLGEHATTGRIDVASFWLRRARRLLPALVLVVAWAIVYARWIGPGVGVRADAVATLAYVANWWEITEETSYFAGFDAAGPLMHTWSLAIEEQWYLLWPLVVWAWLGFAGPRRRRAAAIVIATLTLASATAMSLLAGASDPSRAYYGTDTRAQTLLVGALLAVVLGPSGRVGPIEPAHRRGIALAGGVAVAGFLAMTALVGDNERWMYHGGFLAAAVLSAVAILGVRTAPTALAARALGARPFAAIGRISYGLYLWHWPVYLVVEPGRVGVDGWALLALRLAVTFAMAWASYRAVEMPIRSARPHRIAIPAGLAGATATAVVGAVALAPVAGGLSAGDQIRITAALPSAVVAAESSSTPATRPSRVPAPVETAAPPRTIHPPDRTPMASAPPRAAMRTWSDDPRPAARAASVLVVGDSVYAQLLRISDGVPSIARFTMTADVRLGCGTVTDDRNPKCASQLASWHASVETDRPDLVLAGLSTWDAGDYELDGHRIEFGTPRHEELLRTAWTENIDALTATGARLVVVGLPCVSGRSTRDDTTREQRTQPTRTARVNELVREVVAGRERPDVTWLDPRLLTCPNGTFQPTLDGLTLFYDGIHYTDEAMPLVWDWLAVRLDRVLRDG